MTGQIGLDFGDEPQSASLQIHRGPIEPVEVLIVAECQFEAKPCGLCGKPKSNTVHRKKNVDEGKPFCAFKRQNGCAACGAAKGDDAHFGAPPSLNVFSGRDPATYRSMIEQWKSVVLDRLREALPDERFGHVLVEGLVTFPKAARRDQGNHRVLLEKACGDALTEGGWLADDTWEQYIFGNLEHEIVPGRSATRLLIFPRA